MVQGLGVGEAGDVWGGGGGAGGKTPLRGAAHEHLVQTCGVGVRTQRGGKVPFRGGPADKHLAQTCRVGAWGESGEGVGRPSRENSQQEAGADLQQAYMHCSEGAVTKLIWKPEVVCEEVGHVVVQPFKHVQSIVDEEDCVIIAIQHPLEVVVAMQVGRQKGGHSRPANSQKGVKLSVMQI